MCAPSRRTAEDGALLVEMVIVAALLLLIVPTALRWLNDLSDQTATVQAHTRSLGEAEQILDLIADDLGSARSCRTTLVDSPILTLDWDRIEFVADIDNDGFGEYVHYWREEGILYRQTGDLPNDGSACGAVDYSEEDWVGEAEPLARVKSTHPLFEAERADGNGTVPNVDELTITCPDLDGGPGACSFVAVSANLEIDTGSQTTVTVTRRVAIHPRWGRAG